MADTVRESRAGDDFHLLWAARRALALIDPRSNLSLVRLEGLNPADVEDGDDRFLGVDLTEYFGGSTLDTARRVVVSQLKYSVRHPNRKWTAARLTTARRRGGASVLRRLAQIFEGLVEEIEGDRELVVQRVCIRLVSNQPVDEAVLKVLERVRDLQSHRSDGVQIGQVTRDLSDNERQIVRRLSDGSRLQSADFAAFLRMLDLSQCGVESRLLHRVRLGEAARRSVVGPAVHGLPELLELVRHEILPESAESPGLEREDVLAALGAGREDELFPAPSRFDVPDHLVPAPDPAELACLLLEAEKGRAIAHGPAGVGKTTTIRSISAHLPPGSVLLQFDCFGGGDYLSPGEERHTARRALVQLANELAVEVGTAPFVLSPAATDADIWRRFRERLSEATSALPDSAVLVLVIDAADNATYAASQRGGKSFIEDLWQVPLPPSLRLLMTCRTHRLQEICPPDGIEMYELVGFDLQQSTEMLRSRFPEATDAEAQTFHERTKGVPRVQAYHLAESGNQGLPGLLDRAQRGLKQVFEDVLSSALTERTDRASAQWEIATLYAMVRPVKLSSLAQALSVSLDTARRIAASLQPGVVVQEDRLTFPDEDFEDFLRRSLTDPERKQAHSRLADHFLEFQDSDPEAATVVADHLKLSGRDRELIELTLAEPNPAALADGVARAMLVRRRLKLALESCAREGSTEEGLRLLLFAAQAVRSDANLTAVVRSRPDLAARFADPEAVASIYLREANDPWLGPAHFRIAADLAWRPETSDLAKEHLQLGVAWARRWSQLDESERRRWELTAEDVARGTSAQWGLRGAAHAAESLARWRPLELRLEALSALAEIMAKRLDSRSIASALKQARASAWIQAQFIVALERLGKQPAKSWVKQTARRLSKIKASHPILARPSRASLTNRRPRWYFAFCESAAASGVPKRILIALIERFGQKFPSHGLSRYDVGDDWLIPLQTACLLAVLDGRELTAEELVPAELRPKSTSGPGTYDENESERRKFLELVRPFHPICLARGRVLIERLSVDMLEEVVREQLKAFRAKASNPWFRERHRFWNWATIAVETVMLAQGDSLPLLREVAAETEIVRDLSAEYQLHLAELLDRKGEHEDFGLELAHRAVKKLKKKPLPASELRDALLDATSLALRHDAELAGDYFAYALEASQGIDLDIGRQISVFARLSEFDAASGVTETTRGALAECLIRSVEGAEPFVSDARDPLPYLQVVASVAQLTPPAALALCSRWDDEDRLPVSQSLLVAVPLACEQGWLAPELGLRLLGLSHLGRERLKATLALLDQIACRGPNARASLADSFGQAAVWVLRDVRIAQRVDFAEQLLRWARAAQLDGTAPAQELARLVDFASTLEDREGTEHRADSGSSYLPTRSGESQVPATGEATEMSRAVQEMLDQYQGEIEISRYLVGYLETTSPWERVANLDQVVSLAEERPTQSAVALAVSRTLRRFLEEWADSTAVKQWADDAIPSFLSRHLLRLFSIETTSYDDWFTALNLPFELDAERVQVVLSICAGQLESLSAAQLLAVAEAVGATLPAASRAEIVEPALKQLVPFEGAPAQLPTDAVDATGQLLWSFLGHPDQRMRWRAAHRALEIIMGDQGAQFAEALVSNLDKQQPTAYRSGQLEFYRYSATMWTLMVLARAALDKPGLPAALVDRLTAIATDQNEPHAAIREFARRASLSIARGCPGILSPEAVEELRVTNRPAACIADRERYHEREWTTGASVDLETRFPFDTMDTTRYWYVPLARVFGISADEVTIRADRWITDRWGRTKDDAYSDSRRAFEGEDWRLQSNDHGKLPIVENLRTYLEYHSMLLVAGELLDERHAVNVANYDDPEDPWEDWLGGHLTADRACWLADRRSPTPLDSIYYGSVPNSLSLSEDPEPVFDSILGLGNENKILTVAGWVTSTAPIHYLDAYISSALVSSEAGAALLRALQTAPSALFRLPFAGEGRGSESSEIQELGFELDGWLEHSEVLRNGLDRHDPFAPSCATYRNVPGNEFQKLNGIEIDATGCRLRRRSGQEVAWIEIWSDESEPGEREADPPSSEGNRTRVSVDYLLEYLGRVDRSLIIECRVSTHATWRRGRRTDQEARENSYERTRIYLVRADGTVETIEGSRRPWDSDRTGAGTRRNN